MNELVVVIVGLGPRGLSVLERLVAHAQLPQYRDHRFRVHIVDPTCKGAGLHVVSQPDYLLLNIICGQVSQFPDPSSVEGAPATAGPSLYEWAVGHDFRLEDDYRVGSTGREIQPGDFLPRRILGQYLGWCLTHLLTAAPDTVEVDFHPTRAVTLESTERPVTVSLADGSEISADHVFLTVGNPTGVSAMSAMERELHVISNPYPLPAQVEQVRGGETLAIAGLGLTAVDVILTLTLGRGGTFRVDDGGIRRYVPSGEEPSIVAFSRTGLPYRARPALGEPYRQPVVFTTDAVDAARNARGGLLDFERDVLPLLLTEMRIAYHLARIRRDEGIRARDNLRQRISSFAIKGIDLEAELNRLDQAYGEFNSGEAYFGPLVWPDLAVSDLMRRGADPLGQIVSVHDVEFFDSGTYQKTLTDWIMADLEMAESGVLGSPTKAALEICRELRDVLRRAVDFGGLAPESQDRFFAYHAKLIDRLVVGPQKERCADLLALLASGILAIPLGSDPEVRWDAREMRWILRSRRLRRPETRTARWLYRADRATPGDLEDDRGPIGGLIRAGLVRRHRPNSRVVRAIDLDHCHHPISNQGVPLLAVTVLGPACEGVTYYNNYLASPGKYSKAAHEADQAVMEALIAGLSANASASWQEAQE